MFGAMIRFSLAVGLLLAAAAPGAGAKEAKTWYVYCEGNGQGLHWAVFSQNIWPHAASDDYGRRVGSAAEQFFETRHEVSLTGCSGVEFFDRTSARYSRNRTVKLHKKMGDRVYFFDLPDHVLPD